MDTFKKLQQEMDDLTTKNLPITSGPGPYTRMLLENYQPPISSRTTKQWPPLPLDGVDVNLIDPAKLAQLLAAQARLLGIPSSETNAIHLGKLLKRQEAGLERFRVLRMLQLADLDNLTAVEATERLYELRGQRQAF